MLCLFPRKGPADAEPLARAEEVGVEPGRPRGVAGSAPPAPTPAVVASPEAIKSLMLKMIELLHALEENTATRKEAISQRSGARAVAEQTVGCWSGRAVGHALA